MQMAKRKLKRNKEAHQKHRKKKSRSDHNSSNGDSSINSSSSSIDSDVSLSSVDEELKKKLKKLKKKAKEKRKKKKKIKYSPKINEVKNQRFSNVEVVQGPSASLMKDSLIEKSKSFAPMSKEEWEKQQNTLKHIFDEATGRMRLVKGTGEIVEECVSRERHLAINKQATMNDDVVEKFYGVYLLKCLNPKYKGRTYIGFTVDPNRRIMQHNKGKQFGGAWRTSQRGPWEMTLTVHGFPSEVAALRFEWAWQHPKRSKRLKSIISNKKNSESSFDYCLKIMFTMLTIPPWCRLPLTLRWLSADVMVEPPPNLTPPMHMPIVFGPVKSKKLKSPKKKGDSSKSPDEIEMLYTCQLCHSLLTQKEGFVCLNTKCQVRWHILCLSKYFLDNEFSFMGIQHDESASQNILPVEGTCPSCQCAILWGDLVRKKNGCYNDISNTEENDKLGEETYEDEDFLINSSNL